MDLRRGFDYRIVITRLSEEDGGGYLASVPSLPGCESDGETQEEALKNVHDAINAWVKTAQELNRKIPETDIYKTDEQYSGKLSLRLPIYLHRQLADRSEEEGCSINQLIMSYIAYGLGRASEINRNISILIEQRENASEKMLLDKEFVRKWRSINPVESLFESLDYKINDDKQPLIKSRIRDYQ